MPIPDLVPIDSSAFTGHHFDPDTGELHIQYKGGGIYRFDGVPMEKYAALVDNASPGAFLNEKIKGLYPATKVQD